MAATAREGNMRTSTESVPPGRRSQTGKAAARLVLLLAVAAVLGAATVGLTTTSSTEYCLSCHEMKTHAEELKRSSHAVDADKKPIECAQCHIPHSFGGRFLVVKVGLGLQDLWAHHFTDPASWNRREMQAFATRFVPDDNCLKCHPDLMKDAKNKGPVSLEGRLAHESYLGKNGEGRKNCAGCHANMAHLPTFDRRYEKNSAFAARLAEAGIVDPY